MFLAAHILVSHSSRYLIASYHGPKGKCVKTLIQSDLKLVSPLSICATTALAALKWDHRYHYQEVLKFRITVSSNGGLAVPAEQQINTKLLAVFVGVVQVA